MSTKAKSLYAGLNKGGCTIMGKDITPSLVSRYSSAIGNTQDKINAMQKEHNMENEYIVRRLTPLECCRLQGFPDGWGEIDHKDEFTDEEYAFWLEVRNTYATINGRKTQEYTKEQMLSWYNKLHTDSAEYKMWGNGIALPTALYVMEGIEDAFKERT